ncbi:IS5 family transposase [Singulisphaera sp. Ch08]|uniref:IS5 family transposase n=1 Tax=Singulisphaera sp. Ch08 TaxID=3120278 RepID=A0AAU7CBI4_9BACT
MAKPLLPDELWERIEPLLPPPKPRRFRFPGRKPIDDRKALTGILFVLKTGIPWEDLPQEMGCGSGMTCWRRLRDWHRAGVWQRLHELLLAELRGANRIDWSRAVVDSASVRALGVGEKTGPNPTDRAKPGSKHHVITDGGGIPLAAILTGANAPDVTQLEALVDAIPSVRGKPGRPRRRPRALYADRAYDSAPHRRRLRSRGILPRIARRNTPHGSGLGRYRWVVERTLSWLHKPRKLRLRTERRSDIHEALMSIACAIICFNVLASSFC